MTKHANEFLFGAGFISMLYCLNLVFQQNLIGYAGMAGGFILLSIGLLQEQQT